MSLLISISTTCFWLVTFSKRNKLDAKPLLSINQSLNQKILMLKLHHIESRKLQSHLVPFMCSLLIGRKKEEPIRKKDKCRKKAAHQQKEKRKNSHEVNGVGHHQQVVVVKEVHFGHLQDEEVEKLHEEHEEEFSDAADLQEDGAGQQAEQHAGREVLRRQTLVFLRSAEAAGSSEVSLHDSMEQYGLFSLM